MLRKKDKKVFNEDENQRGAFSDLNREKPKRGTVFDAFLGCMMIVAVVFGYVLLTRNADTPQKQVPIEYSVVVDNVPEEIKNSAKVGDAVRDGVTNSQIGKITYVEVYPYTLATDDLENGTKKQTEMPGRYTVLITIEANASKSGGSFSVDGKEIAAGLYLPIQSANFSGEGYCVTVKEK